MARIIDNQQKNLVGAKLRQIRKAKHMTQQQLSDKLEVLAIYICRGPSPALKIRPGQSPTWSCMGCRRF